MTIDLFRTSIAANRLKEGSAAPAYIAIQFCGWVVLSLVLQQIDIAIAGGRHETTLVHALGVVLISALGLAWCYRANGADQFVQRFVVLALPLTLRFYVAYQSIYWVAYFVYPSLTRSLSDEAYASTWLGFELLLSLLVTTMWYWRMTVWMRRCF